jgi:hypothetical protein
MDEKAFGMGGSKAALFCRCLPGAFVINLISLCTRAEPKQMASERITLLFCTAVSLALTAITFIALNALGIIWWGLEGDFALGMVGGFIGGIGFDIFQQREQLLREKSDQLLQKYVAEGQKISGEAIRKIREKHGKAIG